MKTFLGYFLLVVLLFTAGCALTLNVNKQVESVPTEQNKFACPELYAPVCGADGQTYGNECLAMKQNQVAVDYRGECHDSNVVVDSPSVNAPVTLPLTVTGVARVFENTLQVAVVDSVSQKVLASQTVMSNASDAGQFGAFSVVFGYLIDLPTTEAVTVKAYWLSPKDGSVLDEQNVPIKISLTDVLNLKIAFYGRDFDKNLDCSKVTLVTRIVPKTVATAARALALLLAGPDPLELRNNYVTKIPADTKLNKIAISDGVAKVDFNEQLDKGVSGSCWVAAIRSQIEKTLKQFVTIKKVIISIDGRTEDILQP